MDSAEFGIRSEVAGLARTWEILSEHFERDCILRFCSSAWI